MFTFFSKTTARICSNFFPGLSENTMFTTICCEKYCCPIKVVCHGHVCRVNKDPPLSDLDALSQNCNTEKNIENDSEYQTKIYDVV